MPNYFERNKNYNGNPPDIEKYKELINPNKMTDYHRGFRNGMYLGAAIVLITLSILKIIAH